MNTALHKKELAVARLAVLSEKELETLIAACVYGSQKNAAINLNRSYSTVHNHVANAYSVLEISGIEQFAILATFAGYFDQYPLP